MLPRYRLIFIGALLFVGAAYIQPRDDPGRTVRSITPEEARAALLQVKAPGMGAPDDPVTLDLKTGPITSRSAMTVDIGQFVGCDLAAQTWSQDYGRFCRTHNEGRFERRPDGNWRAIWTTGHIA